MQTKLMATASIRYYLLSLLVIEANYLLSSHYIVYEHGSMLHK